MVSGGALELTGGADEFQQVMLSVREKSLDDCIHEISFRIKKSLPGGDLPSRDCTVVSFDLVESSAPRMLEVVKQEQDES